MILQLVLIIKYNNPKAATVHFCWCRIFKLEIKVPIQTSYITRLVVPWRDKVPQIFNLIIFITKPRQVNMKSDIVASQVLFTRFRLLQASLRWKSGWFLLMNTSEAEDIAMFSLLFFITGMVYLWEWSSQYNANANSYMTPAGDSALTSDCEIECSDHRSWETAMLIEGGWWWVVCDQTPI